MNVRPCFLVILPSTQMFQTVPDVTTKPKQSLDRATTETRGTTEGLSPPLDAKSQGVYEKVTSTHDDARRKTCTHPADKVNLPQLPGSADTLLSGTRQPLPEAPPCQPDSRISFRMSEARKE